MAGNKKTKKPQKVVRINNPMQKSMRDEIALELRLAVEAMILAPSEETAQQIASFLLTLATAINSVGKLKGKVYVLDRKDDDATAIRDALEALQDVEARFSRVGKYGVSPEESARLRAASNGLDSALARVPYNVFQEACLAVRRMNMQYKLAA
jgi:hypothetical protein